MSASGHLFAFKNYRRTAAALTASPALWWSLAVLLMAAGLGVRMINLKNPPLDFHPTRQLRSAIIARGMYYQALPTADAEVRTTAVGLWSTMEQYEPPLFERLVAFTYRLAGGEYVWIARIYSSLFWVIGAAALFALVWRIFSPVAALFALGFDLFLPWGVVASRAFQPDPFMVMWIFLAALALYRWQETRARSWLWTVLAGLLCGIAMLVKVMAAFPLVGIAFFVLVTFIFEDRKPFSGIWQLLRRPQVWVFAILSAAIPLYYYVGLGQRSSEFASFWIFSFVGMLADHKFYIRWLGLIRGIVDIMIFFTALLGIFLFPRRGRALAAGMWLGYLLLGLTFPFQIYTHDYYSLMLVPILAFSLSVYADLVLKGLRSRSLVWQIAFILLFLSIAGYYAYVARSQVAVSNYFAEPVPWQKMGQELPRDKSIIALTHDYGSRLKYYSWRTVNRMWPTQGDLELSQAAGGNKISDFEPYFKDQTAGMDYFLVTLFSSLESQPDLKSMLYDHYPIAQQGDGYVLFDLHSPKP